MSLIEDALREIRATAPRNADVLHDLEDRLKSENSTLLVPVVGAGLSRPMGLPLWGEFLEGLAGECGCAAGVRALLEQGRFEDAASQVEDGLGRIGLQSRIRQTFGEARPRRAVAGAVRVLPDLSIGPVITTNFDDVLETVFEGEGYPFEEVIWGPMVDRIRTAVGERRRYLWKIHGDAGESAHRVLTRQEYDRHYASVEPGGPQAQLKSIFQSCALLFIGCSLNRDRTLRLLKEVAEERPDQVHYAIVQKPGTAAEFASKQQLLASCGIRPIWHPRRQFHLIEPLLRHLADLRPARPEPELALHSPRHRKPEIHGDLDLMSPYARTTTMVGRDRDLDELCRWVKSDAEVSVRVVVGGGGTGKTRLAIELLDWLEEQPEGRWQAGFLSRVEMERFQHRTRLCEWRRRRPVLAVVDSASAAGGPLRDWLRGLAASSGGGARFRLLLLEQEASFDSGWLQGALEPDASGRRADILFHPHGPVRLPPVAGLPDRFKLLEQAIEAAARWRGTIPPEFPQPGANPSLDQSLAGAQWGNPLNLMMAGSVSLDRGLADAVSLSRTDLALSLAAKHPARRLRNVADLEGLSKPEQTVAERLLHHLAAWVTASGGLDGPRLRAAARSESDALAVEFPGGAERLAECVAAVWPGGGKGGAGPVSPELVGEALLLTVFGGTAVEDGSRALCRAMAGCPAEVAAAVTRTAQDFSGDGVPVDQRRSEPQRWLEAMARTGDHETLHWLAAMVSAVPSASSVLREGAVEIGTRLADVLRAGLEKDSSREGRAELARVLSQLGSRLSGLGRRERAVAAGEEAVSHYRQLGLERPDEYLPDLAASLNNLGAMLSGLGRREEAWAVTEEAVGHYRRVAAERPDEYLSDLARSLNNLGNRLSESGRREEALAASQEAVGHYRRLAAEHQDTFLPNLAASLNNLGAMLSGLGRREEALAATEEAVALRRQLAAEKPAMHLANLPRSLNNLGSRLSEVGRREEALAVTAEAVGHYRQLAAQQPDVFLPELATSLSNLGGLQASLGLPAEALATTEEAVTRRRQLAAKRPQAFLPDLARSLSQLASRREAMGRPEEALAAAEEAVDHYRPLAAERPATFLQLLAKALDSLSARLNDLGRTEEALAVTNEQVEHYRQLVAEQSRGFLPDLARSLRGLAARLGELGHPEAALSATEEEVDLYRQLASDRPHEFLPEVAGALRSLGSRLGELGQRETSLAAASEAVDLYRGLAEVRPDKFLADLARSIESRGQRLNENGRQAEALAATEECVALYRRLAQERPEQFLPDLARSLRTLGERLGEMGRREESLKTIEEALGPYRQLARERPAQFQDQFAALLQGLSDSLSEMGRREEALTANEDAVDQYRRLTAERPGEFLPFLARSLQTLGNRLSESGEHWLALGAGEEGVGIFRQLYAQNPSAFLPHLAKAIRTLVGRLSEVGRRDDALWVNREEVDLYRQLTAETPGFLPELAKALHSLVRRLSEAGRCEEALEAAEESVRLRRDLAAAGQEAELADLARSLGACGAAFASVQRQAQAAAQFHAGLSVLKPLFAGAPGTFRPLVRGLCHDYLAALEAGKLEPDLALLADLLPRLDA